MVMKRKFETDFPGVVAILLGLIMWLIVPVISTPVLTPAVRALGLLLIFFGFISLTRGVGILARWREGLLHGTFWNPTPRRLKPTPFAVLWCS